LKRFGAIGGRNVRLAAAERRNSRLRDLLQIGSGEGAWRKSLVRASLVRVRLMFKEER